MLLSCHGITKSFGTDEILKHISFGVEEHDRLALVGANGAGKTTLLKIIIGELSADAGSVTLAKGKTLGYLAQQGMFTPGTTIFEEALLARKDLLEMEETLHDMEERMKSLQGDALEALMNQYHHLQTSFEREDGYALRSEAAGILRGLGFREEDFSRRSDTLSGGQRTRLALARLLLFSPDILLLDEPTNHLDIESVAWLESYLRASRCAMILVSHDRYFLDRIVGRVAELEHGTLTCYEGDYTAFAEKKKKLREAALRAWLKQQQEIRHQEEVIEKLRSFNREKSIKRAESREKKLAKMDVLEKPSQEAGEMRLTIEPDILSGKDVLHIENLGKAFGSLTLFTGLSMDIRRGERIALIGDNGTGKTTLLKIINGLEEADDGSLSLGANVLIGYYDQEQQQLDSEKTLFEEISDAYPELNNNRIRSILAAFLFTGEDVFKRIGDLSGGERGRVSLAKLMLSGANFLILDEPTNHLDIASREILESALTQYAGTVLYVSHDRYFINQTATRILNLDGKGLTGYPGNYDYFLEKTQQQDTSPDAAAKKAQAPESASQQSWLAQKEKEARERKRKNDLRRTEEQITLLEEEDQQLDEELSLEENYTNQEKCLALSRRKAEVAEKLEELYALWETLAED